VYRYGTLNSGKSIKEDPVKINPKAAQPLLQDQLIRDTKIGKDSSGVKSKATPMQMKEAAHVNVSERAKNIQRATEIAKQDTVDEAKVARLQKMIDNGEYKVDADQVAEKLLNEHLMTSSS
jgi:flagellar biosynthesis anti-sigma factor FlgM